VRKEAKNRKLEERMKYIKLQDECGAMVLKVSAVFEPRLSNFR